MSVCQNEGAVLGVGETHHSNFFHKKTCGRLEKEKSRLGAPSDAEVINDPTAETGSLYYLHALYVVSD